MGRRLDRVGVSGSYVRVAGNSAATSGISERAMSTRGEAPAMGRRRSVLRRHAAQRRAGAKAPPATVRGRSPAACGRDCAPRCRASWPPGRGGRPCGAAQARCGLRSICSSVGTGASPLSWGGVATGFDASAGRCSGRISGPSQTTIAPSMAWSSSRTLPGQLWRPSAAIASVPMRFENPNRALNCFVKYSARSATSPWRSRSGGTRSVMVLMR